MEFEDGIVTPEHWFRQSYQMYEASRVLYESLASSKIEVTESDTFRRVGSMKGALLLLGLAVENALKGAHVRKLKPSLSNGKLDLKQFSGSSNSHGLSGIADALEHSLSDELRECLDRLTIFVTWASKYQTAKSEVDQIAATGKLKLNYPNDYIMVMNLIKELQLQAGYNEHSGWPTEC